MTYKIKFKNKITRTNKTKEKNKKTLLNKSKYFHKLLNYIH